MRAQSAVLIGAIETRARTNARLYKLQLDSLTPADVPGQDLESAKRTLWNKFYADLELSATEEFNQAQASTLIESNNYILMTSHWTSLSANFPLMSERIVAVDAYAGRFKSYASLPFLFTLSHTRFRESQRTGKLFLTINAQLAFNNSFIGNQLLQIDRSEFTAHGGVDTLSFSKTSDPKFIGKFKTFLTPMVTLKGIFFPTESHIGLSLSITKSFLDYNPLNFVIGIPVVLIDKEGHPAANFEFQVQCFDVNHTVFPNMNLTDKTSVSLTIGVPFSKIMH